MSCESMGMGHDCTTRGMQLTESGEVRMCKYIGKFRHDGRRLCPQCEGRGECRHVEIRDEREFRVKHPSSLTQDITPVRRTVSR